MSKSNKVEFVQVGITTDEKLVLSNVYCFFETYGVPLDMIFTIIKEKNSIVSWLHFCQEAMKAGLKKQRILAKLEEAICDSWGKEICDKIIYVLNKIDFEWLKNIDLETVNYLDIEAKNKYLTQIK